MRITEVEISLTIINKLYKRNVTEDEVRQVLLYDETVIVYRTGRGKRRGRKQKQERRYLAYGRTFASRYLLVVFDLHEKSVASVATARDMSPSERRLYERG
jgi:uncharacterized DUF497 family protein